MSAADRPDHRSPEYQGADRIAAARAHRPAVDANGYPLNDQPRRTFRYGPDGQLDGVDTEPDKPATP